MADELNNNESQSNESIALSNEELDNILDGAELSETEFEYNAPEVSEDIDNAELINNDISSDLSDEDISIDLPEDNELDLEAPSDVPADLPMEEEDLNLDISEESVSLDEASDILNSVDVGEEQSDDSAEVAGDESIDDMYSLDLDNTEAETGSEELDIESVSDIPEIDQAADQALVDELAANEIDEVSPSDTPKGKGEDLISLSEDEMQNILSDVDEGNVIDISVDSANNAAPIETPVTEQPDIEAADMLSDDIEEIEEELTEVVEQEESSAAATDTDKTFMPEDDDTIALSGKELDNILKESTSLSEDQVIDDISSAKPAVEEIEKSSNVKESIDFENEIMNEANKDSNEEIPDESDLIAIEDKKDGISEPEEDLIEEQLIDEIHSEIDEIDEDTIEEVEELEEEISAMSAPAAKKSKNEIDEIERELDNEIKQKGMIKKAMSKKKQIIAKGKVKDTELQEIFSYLDNLLENLPKDLIEQFAESEYYDLYTSIINRLGLG